jgi:hypothetical protein
MRNKDLRLVVDCFKTLYESVCGIDNFQLKMSDSRLKMTLNFIENCKKFNNTTIIGEDYIMSYMEFQFNYWYRVDGKFGKGKSIQLEWIIGIKAWKRWIGRSEKQKKSSDYFVRKDLKSKVKVKRKIKIDPLVKNRFVNINDEEEFEKKLFFNSSKGFINCTINTTLYNHKSKICSDCNFKEKCKSELKNRFINVYKIRGY